MTKELDALHAKVCVIAILLPASYADFMAFFWNNLYQQ